MEYLTTWLSGICLTSLIALFWNFPLIISNFSNLSFYKHLNVNFNYNNYCSVGNTELCLLNLLILIAFCVTFTLVCSLRACHTWLTRTHMFICEVWGKFTSFIFWNLSQIYLLINMWLLELIQPQNAPRPFQIP